MPPHVRRVRHARLAASVARSPHRVRLLEFLLVLAVLSAAVWVIAGPLRAAQRGVGAPAPDAADRPEAPPAPADGVTGLQAAKEAKYREIRDAELDFRTGKLSDADYRALDAELRAEAVEILRALDAAEAGDQGSGQSTS